MELVVYRNFKIAIPKKYAIPILLNRFQTNVYENDEVTCVKDFLPSDCVLELGSSIGYVTLNLAKQVSKVVAVEANPELISTLKQTCELNAITNVEVENCIIDPSTQSKSFLTNNMAFAGSADRADWLHHESRKMPYEIISHTVPCMSVQELEKKCNCSFTSIVMDIEGGELPFLEQHRDILKNQIQRVMIELHQRFMNDPNFNAKCITILKECGFTVKKTLGNVIYCDKI